MLLDCKPISSQGLALDGDVCSDTPAPIGNEEQLQMAVKLLPKVSACVHGSEEKLPRTFVNVSEAKLNTTLFYVTQQTSLGSACHFCFVHTADTTPISTALFHRQTISLARGESVEVLCSTVVLLSAEVDPWSIFVKLPGVDDDPILQKEIHAGSCLPIAMIASALPRSCQLGQPPTLLTSLKIAADCKEKSCIKVSPSSPMAASEPPTPTKRALARRRARARRRTSVGSTDSMDVCFEHVMETIDVRKMQATQVCSEMPSARLLGKIPVVNTFVHFAIARGWDQEFTGRPARMMSWPPDQRFERVAF